jgi:hypothetical protein
MWREASRRLLLRSNQHDLEVQHPIPSTFPSGRSILRRHNDGADSPPITAQPRSRSQARLVGSLTLTMTRALGIVA